MSTSHLLNIAETYYDAMVTKNFAVMANCLHPEVNLVSPLAKLEGKQSVLESAKQLSGKCQAINIRAKFAEGDQIMLAYDFSLPEPINELRAAVLMTFKEDLIVKIELFFDARPYGIAS